MGRWGESKEPWYRTPPPKWYKAMGRYGVWTGLVISIVSLVIAIIALQVR